MKMVQSLLIRLLVVWLVTRSANAQDGLLFPHGEGDLSVENGLDYSSEEIIIPVHFPFFSQSVTSAYVSTNGVISFGQEFTEYIPEPFPLGSNTTSTYTSILAVFWSDSDISIGIGNVTYRPYLRNSFNEDVFGRAEAVIRQAFGNQFDFFSASWMLIATWNKVPFYGSNHNSNTNTYQAVILTDSTLSFAMYNYEEIAWTTGTASGGDSDTGLGGDPAQVGYNADDGINYYSVPDSMTDAIVNIDQRSNIGTRGRWLFRIDTDLERPIVACPHDVTVSVDVGMTDTSVIWSSLPSAIGIVDGVIDPGSIICEDPEGNVKMSGDRIGTGITTITCTTNDTAQYEGSCQFTIRVNDTEPPVVNCPEDTVFSLAFGASHAAVHWTDMPTATDVVDGNITTITCSDENNSTVSSGGLYTIGVTIVTCTARDDAFNPGDCTFYVSVSDNDAPTIQSCPDDVILPTRLTNPASLPYSWTPPVFSDNSGQSVDVVFGCLATVFNECRQDGQGYFSAGVTEVMYNGTDTSGNQNFCNFTITVKEVDLVCSLNVTVSTDPGSSTARVNWQEPNLTGWDGTNFTSTAVSGDAFSIGSQRVTYQQWFGINNLVFTCSFGVEVLDTEPPGINGCPDDAIIPVVSTNPVPYSWTPPVFYDNSGQSVDVVIGCLDTVSNECHQGGYGTFSVGDTEVMYNGTDTSGNQHYCHFTITVKVVDLVCPTFFSVMANPGLNSTGVNWQEPDLTGWDETNFTSSAVSGDVFLVGSQRVTYQQWFGINNLVLHCSFGFLVVGQCAPEVTEDTVLGSLSWPVTMAGLTAGSIERCPLSTTNAGFPRAERNCSTAPPPLYFYWEEHVPKSCGGEVKTITVEDIVEVDVTEGNAEEVAEFLVNKTSSTAPSSDDDVEVISQILENIVNAGSGAPEVTDAVIETVANVIADAKERQDAPDSRSSSAILQSVEAQVSLTLQQGGNIHCKKVG